MIGISSKPFESFFNLEGTKETWIHHQEQGRNKSGIRISVGFSEGPLDLSFHF